MQVESDILTHLEMTSVVGDSTDSEGAYQA